MKKEQIYDFLKSNKIGFTQREIHRKTGISIPTLIKWIPILEKEGKIQTKRYSNVKIIKVLE